MKPGIKKILDHWHPVLPSAQLKSRPVEVMLAGQPIVVFRDGRGQLGALSTRCPHRGMNLSYGKIQPEGLSCLYHGWRFTADGNGKSPCNPKLKVKTQAYDVREQAGFIWLSGQDSGAPFPDFIPAGYRLIGKHVRKVDAPLEPVIDNFFEVEHFPTAHSWLDFGFPQIAKSDLIFESGETEVKMNFYPTDPLAAWFRKLFRLPDGSRYFMDITAYSSPLYTIHHQGWHSPASGHKQTLMINAVFYVPISRQTTLLVMFLLAEPNPLALLTDVFIRKKTKQLIDDDMVILNHLSDKQMGVKDMRLGFYDKGLIELRKRLPRLYADYYQPESQSQSQSQSQTNSQAHSQALQSLCQGETPLRAVEPVPETQAVRSAD